MNSGKLTTNHQGRLILGVASQLGGAVPADFDNFLVELLRSGSSGLILLGHPPYPKVSGLHTVVVENIGELDLVHGRTGQTSKLFALYDPGLASAVFRRRRAAKLVRPHLDNHTRTRTPPIVLVGGTRVGSNSRTTVLEFVGGAWIVQVGVFNPLPPLSSLHPAGAARDKSYGGSIVEIDLADRNCPVTPTFRDYQQR